MLSMDDNDYVVCRFLDIQTLYVTHWIRNIKIHKL
jgi:hypothetical protein